MPVSPHFVVADLNIGLLFVLAMSSLAVYSVTLAGWSSRSKYSLIGGMRAAAQMMSYEVFMGLSLTGVVHAGRLVQPGQHRRAAAAPLVHRAADLPGFVVFVIAGLAETRRIPFDLVEAESELVAGYHTEYTGMKFGMFFVGEYLGVTLVSALISVLFFGGWLGPRAAGLAVAPRQDRRSSSRCSSWCARPCRGRATTSSWLWAGRSCCPLSLLNLLVTGAIILAVH